MRAAVATCLALATLSRAAAASPSARLVYSRSGDAASCPDEEALRRAVAARFGYDPFFLWAKQTVVVQIWHGGNRYRSRVQIVGPEGVAAGTRELSSDRDECSQLFDATALAVSIALDASVSSEPVVPPGPAPEASPPAAPTAPAPLVLQIPPAQPPPGLPPAGAAPAVFGGLDMLGSVGTAPSPSGGGALFLGLRSASVSAAIEARVDAPATKDPAGGGGVSSWLFAAGIVPCFHVGLASACLVGSLGQIRASSSGVTTPSSGTALFAVVGARVGAELPLSSLLAVRLHADLLLDVDPYTLRVNGGPVWTAPYVAGTLGAGVVVRFP